ncbi:phospholipase D family protein [Rhizobium ruizarguesonis]
MQLVLNGLNGNYLRNILLNAVDHCERVDAAVAYATEGDLLFEWCWTNKLPLRFWGRFDDQVPVSTHVLEKFITRRSGSYVCKLLRHFHPKVIWWRGYGAYIGSANLTQSAWYNNVEAGVFIPEPELILAGHDLELEDLFHGIDKQAAPLTQELFDLLKNRAGELTRIKHNDKDAAERFWATGFVPPWQGLAHQDKKSARDRQKAEFLKEWNETLQVIRNISAKLVLDKNRPNWIGPAAPSGAQADQFLHAHYYQRTFDGRRADYERFFELHRKDPDGAVEEAMNWWKTLPPSSAENTMLNLIAPQLQNAFSESSVGKLTEVEFANALGKVHAVREYARRASNRLIGLKAGRAYDIPEKVKALTTQIYRAPLRGGNSAINTLSYVLYDGKPDDLPQRLWDALTNPKLKIDLLGVSAFGEIVGWAMPERFPPRNGRTSKALRSLGYDVRVHVT